jgi:hypothetical protein
MNYDLKWGRRYNDDGSEDLDGTFKQAIYNVRVLVEQDKILAVDACKQVRDKMHLTYQEHDKLFKQAKEAYENG